MARTDSAWEKGKRKRTVTCRWCGQEHRRRSRELRECRERAKRGKPPLEVAPVAEEKNQRRQGDEMTRYTTDALRGDKLGHAIAKRLRSGDPERKVAKMYGVSLSRVRGVAEKL